MLINEVKAIQIKKGNTFVLSDDLGNFKKGEEITVINVEKSAEDFIVTMKNDKGIKDTFYLDKDDDI